MLDRFATVSSHTKEAFVYIWEFAYRDIAHSDSGFASRRFRFANGSAVSYRANYHVHETRGEITINTAGCLLKQAAIVPILFVKGTQFLCSIYHHRATWDRWRIAIKKIQNFFLPHISFLRIVELALIAIWISNRHYILIVMMITK